MYVLHQITNIYICRHHFSKCCGNLFISIFVDYHLLMNLVIVRNISENSYYIGFHGRHQIVNGTLAFAIATGKQTTKVKKKLIFAKCTCLHLITQQNTRNAAYIVCWQQRWIWWAYSHASGRYIFSSLVAFNDSLKSRKRAVMFSIPPITCFSVFDSVLYGITARLTYYECVRLLRLHMVYTKKRGW